MVTKTKLFALSKCGCLRGNPLKIGENQAIRQKNWHVFETGGRTYFTFRVDRIDTYINKIGSSATRPLLMSSTVLVPVNRIKLSRQECLPQLHARGRCPSRHSCVLGQRKSQGRFSYFLSVNICLLSDNRWAVKGCMGRRAVCAGGGWGEGETILYQRHEIFGRLHDLP